MAILYIALATAYTLIVFHFTKRHYKKKYREFYRRADPQKLNAFFRPSPMLKTAHLYTVATYRDTRLNNLVASCHIHGLGVHVLGLGNNWQGFGNKWLWTAEYIREQQLPPEAIVAFVDAYDVLCLADPEELVAKFERFGSRVIFSAERGCHPDSNRADLFPSAPTSFRFLNSGGAIGYAADLVEVIDAARFDVAADDQQTFIDYFLANPGKLTLDHNAEIFLSLFDVAADELAVESEHGRIFVKETRSRPCFLHGNGPSVSLLDKLRSELVPVDSLSNT